MPVDVFQIPSKHWFVQYHPDDGWGLTHEDQFLGFAKTGSHVPLLPHLEQSWEDASALVSNAARAANCTAPFPFEALLSTALESSSTYWAKLALAWLEQGYPLTDALAAQGARLTAGRILAQMDEHRLRRLTAQYLGARMPKHD